MPFLISPVAEITFDVTESLNQHLYIFELYLYFPQAFSHAVLQQNTENTNWLTTETIYSPAIHIPSKILIKMIDMQLYDY